MVTPIGSSQNPNVGHQTGAPPGGAVIVRASAHAPVYIVPDHFAALTELCVKNRRPLAGIHVLVVDDDDDARDVFKTVCSFLGALTTTSESATSALGVLARVRPDVIITDIMMPGHDGYWLLEQVRAFDGRIPVLAITANKLADLRAFDGGTYKPIDLEQLTDLVLDALPPGRDQLR